MKKILSVFLTLTMLVTVMLPAAAAVDISDRQNIDTFEELDAAGNSMRFELVYDSDGEYTLNYYFNGILTTVYEITEESPVIAATTMTEQGKRTYTLNNIAYTTVKNAPLRGPDRWGHAGYIQYGYTSRYDCEPYAVVSWKDTDSYVGTYTINTYENSSYSDAVANVVSILIAAGLGVVGNVTTMAAGILTGLIGYFGGQVVDDTISVLFDEEIECSSVTYTMRAQVMGPGVNDTDVVDYEGGIEYWLKYEGAPSEYRYEGWTPANWKCREFAQDVWDDSVPGFTSCPSIQGYPTYI